MTWRDAQSRSSCLYWGKIVHRRLRPVAHRFCYRVLWNLLDLSELPELDRTVAGFSYNRWGVVSFQDRDHGPRDGSPLRPWIDRHLEAAGIDCKGGTIKLLCFPRLFGFVFNPLSVWFCYDGEEHLRAVLYEVCNTFGESHSYLMPIESDEGVSVHRCAKQFHVSPFLPMNCDYGFRLSSPGSAMALHIRQSDDAGDILLASMAGTRRPFSGQSLAQSLARYPLMAVKVVGAIHWQALNLWLKRVPFFTKPEVPRESVTLGTRETAAR
jgi:uncharacterized protein